MPRSCALALASLLLAVGLTHAAAVVLAFVLRGGRLDPRSGKTQKFPLGDGSAPHGVIVGPDGATWIADGGLNAIVHVNPKTGAVTCFPLPKDRKNANLNTAVFDKKGHLWSTGQGGFEPVFRTGVERLRTVLALIVELTTESASGG
ncbi:MAG: SMP-30/Gluconolaconase/LRE domain protein [Herminiimonas sp.]|nr:SMP-30/Gluconolaconase/LRE domain protein [Herminiimonas sp.]